MKIFETSKKPVYLSISDSITTRTLRSIADERRQHRQQNTSQLQSRGAPTDRQVTRDC